MSFIRSAIAPDPYPENALFFIFSDHHIHLWQDNKSHPQIPFIPFEQAAQYGLEDLCYIGMYENKPCFCASAPDNLPLNSVNFRSLYGKMDFEMFWVAGYARQIHDWNINFTFCGRCGSKNLKNATEHSKKCPDCNLISYPRISPAIIVAVTKEDQILLARGINFPNKKMFSVIAGFVEAGETLEACVKREVFEETGITVQQIKYFASQPWPFPDSLMIGFTARYKTGDIHTDPDEIAEAAWFTKDALPLVPQKPSLSGQLIDWFLTSGKY